jgi:hypothetical protein
MLRIEADVVDHAADLRKQLADLDLVLPELRELVLRPEAVQRLALKLRELLSLRERLRHRLAIHLRELRLRIEGLQCDGPPAIVSQITRFAFCGSGSLSKRPASELPQPVSSTKPARRLRGLARFCRGRRGGGEGWGCSRLRGVRRSRPVSRRRLRTRRVTKTREQSRHLAPSR